MNKYKKLLSNTLIFGIGTFSSKVMVYLLMPLYTALLSKAEYSTADLITQAANLLMPLAAIGMYDGIFRFAIDAGEKKKEVFLKKSCRRLSNDLGFCQILSIH